GARRNVQYGPQLGCGPPHQVQGSATWYSPTPVREGNGRVLTVLRLVIVMFIAAATLTVVAQVPELPPQWFENRAPTLDEQEVSFCVDQREPGHVVDAAIAEAIARTLLLQPRLHAVNRTTAEEDGWDRLYLDLVDNCSL